LRQRVALLRFLLQVLVNGKVVDTVRTTVG
jgi:hypothetical protein